MESEFQRLGVLAPSNFGSWIRTRADFAAAIKGGPGMVALVGPKGSGKTYTLTAFALALNKQGARLRDAGQPLEPGVSVDLVDNIDADGARRLDAGRPFPGLRAVAVRPELLEPLLLTHPGLRVVQVGRMSSSDVRTMLQTRREQLRLPADALTFKAFSNFDRFCGGNPRKLDRLFGHAERAARLAGSRKILGEHVAQAERELTTEQHEGMASVAGRRSSPLMPALLPEAPEPGKIEPAETVEPAMDVGPETPVQPAEVLPGEPDPTQELQSAHDAMWARLATPSSPAELAAAAEMSDEPERGGSVLARVCGVLAIVFVLLPIPYYGQVWRLVSIAAVAVRHYALTIAETRPWPAAAGVTGKVPPAVRVPESAADQAPGHPPGLPVMGATAPITGATGGTVNAGVPVSMPSRPSVAVE